MNGMRPRRPAATLLVLAVLLVGGALPPQQAAARQPTAEPWAIEQPDAPRDFQLLGARTLALDGAARPHVVYAGTGLYYAHYDGAAWQYTTVDPSLGAGSGPASLALDADGRPHIAYRADGTLKYAHYDGTTWHSEAVAAGGFRPSLAVDAGGRPHIAYGTSDDVASVNYAWHDGAAWHIETIDSGRWPSLVLDAGGRPHLSYGNSALKYAWHDGSAWHRSVVDLAPGPGSLVLDAAGQPQIAYAAGSPSQVRRAWHDGIGWRIETVAPGSGPALAVDTAGQLHLGYLDGLSLQHAVHDGSAWQTETAAAGDSYGDISIGIDPLGHPNLLALAPTSGELLHTWHDGSAWQIEAIDRAGDTGRYTSLALDAGGWAHISYCQYHRYDNPYPSQCDRLKYAFYDGNAWQVATVEQGVDVGYDTSLAIDAAGQPHISYRRGTALRYAYHDGSAWQLQTVESTGVHDQGTSLALDTAGLPYIAYAYSGALYALKVAWFNGTHWYTTFVETGSGASFRHPSLALDAEGQPHLSYGLYSGTTADALRYAWFDGTDWQVETVDSGPGVGGHTALALDAAGRPHISYSGGNSLKYARYDGSDWHLETVDGGGLYTALALDTAGRPHISSYHPGSMRLRYAWHDGAAWHLEAVDPEAQTGRYGDLALDAGDRPYISYYDAAHYDLRLAHPCVALTGVEIAGPTFLPVGVSASYTAQPLPGNASPPLAYAWDNGAAGPTAVYSWTAPGVYTVSLSAANDCSAAEDTLAVSVTCQPVAGVQVVGPPAIPTGQAGTYQALLQPISPSLPLTVTWDNGTVGPTAAYSWTDPGSYTLTVTATNACGQAHDALTVTAFCQPPLGLAVEGPAVLLPGQSGAYLAQVAPPTSSLPLTITWDNGTVGPAARYSWPLSGTYGLAVTATNACGAAAGALSVTVDCDPVLGVAVSGPAVLVVGYSGTFAVFAQPPTASLPITYTWDNGATGPSASYSWAATGTYTVAATATNGCGSARGSWSVQVVAVPEHRSYLPVVLRGFVPQPCAPPFALSFSWAPFTPTAGQPITWTASASGTAPLSFAWDLGDGMTATGALITHTYAASGTFTVTLRVSNACGEAAAAQALVVGQAAGPAAWINRPALLAGSAAAAAPAKRSLPMGGASTCRAWRSRCLRLPAGPGGATMGQGTAALATSQGRTYACPDRRRPAQGTARPAPAPRAG